MFDDLSDDRCSMYQIRLSATFAPPSLKAFLLEFPALCCAVLCCAAPLAFPLAFRVAAARARRVKSHIGKWQSAARSRALTEPRPVGKSLAVP